jgi:arsenate reductase
MAEAFLNEKAGDIFEATSAGLEPGVLNHLVVTAMTNVGIDISLNKTKSVLDLFKKGVRFDYVISVCDEVNGEKCPIFPGITKRLHWSIPDPSDFTGAHKDRLRKTRQVRDTIEIKIKEFIKELINQDIVHITRREEGRANIAGAAVA